MIHNFFDGQIDSMEEEKDPDTKLRHEFDLLKQKVGQYYEEYALNRALEEIWVYISSVNKYLADNEPWKLAKDETQRRRMGRILYQSACALRGIIPLIFPVMPESSRKIWLFLGEKKPLEEESYSGLEFFHFKFDQKIQKPAPLFPRVNLKDFLKEEESREAPPSKEESMDIITFDEFKKMDLKVGKIMKAERIEGTEKLVTMEINIGTENRQMVAGIADKYSPEELVGKKVIVIVNLKPAVIRGVESRGMLLAAEVGGQAILPVFIEDVPPGAKVR
jgi:methionyl-tRNA synthetase